MSLQLYEQKNQKIKSAFIELKKNHPERLQKRLNFSWSNWGFGMESLTETAERLQQADIRYIELHGNHYGPSLGYKVKETLDILQAHNIKAAIEPIRSAEVSFVHTIADAQKYIQAVNRPGVQYINADVYHMQVEEAHIGEALIAAGGQLINLHMADSNRGALGEGSLDLDTIIMSLYLLGFNTEGKYFTPEPLGPGGDPYPAMYGKPDRSFLNRLVQQSVAYFRERENTLLLL